MKVLVTGSHFTPAQALIDELLKIPDFKIIYLGRKFVRDDDSAKSVESRILPEMGVKFIPITAGKLNRFFSVGTIVSFFKTPVGFIQSFYYLIKERPDIIISFGGFTGLPVVVAGWFLSIPSLVHEQGLKMGLSNLISSFFADKVAISFKDFKIPVFLNPDKFVVTGNPIRKEFLEVVNYPSKEIGDFVKSGSSKLLILVTAGNQGSHKINLLVEDTLTELTKLARVIHQTGDSKFDDFSNLKKHQSKDYLVRKWVDASDLNLILDNTSLVVSRAGINTLIELAVKKTAALIIPIPVGDEQKNNAKYFSEHGLGEFIEEKNISPEVFIKRISTLLKKSKELKKSAEQAATKIIQGAEKRLVFEILLMENSLKNPGLNFR